MKYRIMEKNDNTKTNPFRVADPEKILQERMKHAQKITREELVKGVRKTNAVKARKK